MNNKLNIYITDLLPDLKYLEILNPNLGFEKRKNIFKDKDIFDDFTESVFNLVKDISFADYILIPHNYFQIKSDEEYIKKAESLSNSYSKKIIVFAIGDSYEEVKIKNSIVLRMSQYSHKKLDNEIIMPAYAADLTYGEELSFRDKSDIPSVSFCGYAEDKSLLKNFIFYLKNTFWLRGTMKLGLYFRMKSIKILKRSKKVKTDFIIRRSYGANDRTIELDPVVARNDYKMNILNNDFVLAPKGDGNYSVRFFETLALGRVPILIDTDCTLPLEKDIDYSKIILRVNYRDIDKLDSIVSEFYKGISNENWLAMQENARNVFVKFLRIDSFFRFIFTKDNLNKYAK